MSTLLTFEELAFRSAIEAHPTDGTAARAYIDWLIEHGGRKPMEARREVVRLRREYAEEQQYQRIKLVMSNGSKASQLIQSEFQKRYRVTLHSEYIWHIVKGGGSPRLESVPGFWRNNRGQVVRPEDVPEGHLFRGEWVECWSRVVLPAAWVDCVLREIGYYGNLSSARVQSG